MRAVDVGLVHRAVQAAGHILPSYGRHLHRLQETFAEHHALFHEPSGSREMAFAFVLLVLALAMLQHHVRLCFLVPNVHVVLFELLQTLHMVV